METIMGDLETFNPKLAAQSCLRTRLYGQNLFLVEAELPCASLAGIGFGINQIRAKFILAVAWNY